MAPSDELGGLLGNLDLADHPCAFHSARGVDGVTEQLKSRLGPAQDAGRRGAGVDAEPHVEPPGVQSLAIEAGTHLPDLVSRLEGESSQDDGMVFYRNGLREHDKV